MKDSRSLQHFVPVITDLCVQVAVAVEVTVEVEDEGEVTQSGEISTGRVELQFH